MSINVLDKGTEWKKGDFVLSKNGEWKAVFQEDGNFVVYGWQPVWASDTGGLDPTRLCMQADCNLVMYNPEEKPRWHTNTAKGSCDTCTLYLTDQGKLVLKKNGNEIWNSDHNHGMK
ncbi:unnamed protein product [Tetraodon nigroviridis]|uniref:Chromosome 6 SCAF15017, whole genome shotgun sequence n=1 Tax=Tetraodon nigroviridis TaxID=99883 RepID=Q4RMX9_TETNG|nr:unnamed protein product [Tetraodon nigroviridis]